MVSVAVDFESGAAVVRHDGRDGIERAAIEAVEAAGFHAKVDVDPLVGDAMHQPIARDNRVSELSLRSQASE